MRRKFRDVTDYGLTSLACNILHSNNSDFFSCFHRKRTVFVIALLAKKVRWKQVQPKSGKDGLVEPSSWSQRKIGGTEDKHQSLSVRHILGPLLCPTPHVDVAFSIYICLRTLLTKSTTGCVDVPQSAKNFTTNENLVSHVRTTHAD